MKLRPSTKDRKAIDKLKAYYREATGTKAILRAVYEVPILDEKLVALNNEVQDLTNLLERAMTAQGLVVDGLASINKIRKDIDKKLY